MKKRKLTPKQQAFADYYIETLNGVESAKRAGYKGNNLNRIASENLSKLDIKTYIDEQLQKLADKRIMGAQEALELLTSIARAEITEEVVLSTEDGVAKVDKIPDIRDRQRAAEELLKRYTLGDNQKLKNEMLQAQIDKTKAEIGKITNGSNDEPIEIIVTRKDGR